MKEKNSPIGIFDSGIGGLTVLKEVSRLLPKEDIVYFGDTARVPYGNKSKSTVIKFSTENVLFLLRKKVKIVIVACNTSSALALASLQHTFNIPILGVIEAGVSKAVKMTQSRKIGVIGTKSTVESKSYNLLVKKLDKSVLVYGQCCPLFVPLVEEGILKGKIVDEVIKLYLADFKNKGIDTIILGCTHYPLLKSALVQFFKGVFIVDSAREVARHTKEILFANSLLSERKTKGRKDFYLSDESKGFSDLAHLVLHQPIQKPKIINV